METITKENEKTILGKNTSDNSWLFAELKYSSGVKYFDEIFSKTSKDASKSSIEVGQYSDGIIIKMIIGWKSYLITINSNEIEKITINKHENFLSRLQIDLADKENIILLFKDGDKAKLVGFLEKYTNNKIGVLTTVESKKSSRDESTKGNGIGQIKCPHCQKLNSSDTIKCNCGFYFDKEKYNKSLIHDQNEPLQKYQSVGGWLSLFCLVLIIISPLYSLYNLINRYRHLDIPLYSFI